MTTERELRESVLVDVMERVTSELGEDVLALDWTILNILGESDSPAISKARISNQEALKLLQKIGCKRPVRVAEFRRGIEVEQEHGPKLGKNTNVTSGSLESAARIALAHLKEIPDYYTRLDKMEKDAKKGKKVDEADLDKTIAYASTRKKNLKAILDGKLPIDSPEAKSLVNGSIKRRIRGEERLIKRARRSRIRNRKQGYEPVAKPQELRKRLDGVSLSRDKNGFFVRTHRARCKSYPEPGKIPLKKIQFIRSTG